MSNTPRGFFRFLVSKKDIIHQNGSSQYSLQLEQRCDLKCRSDQSLSSAPRLINHIRDPPPLGRRQKKEHETRQKIRDVTVYPWEGTGGSGCHSPVRRAFFMLQPHLRHFPSAEKIKVCRLTHDRAHNQVNLPFHLLDFQEFSIKSCGFHLQNEHISIESPGSTHFL